MALGPMHADQILPAATLASYAGSYEVPDNGKTLIAEITVEGNTLLWNYDGTGKQRLDPLSETTFSLAGTLIEFVREESGAVTRLLIKAVEDETPGVRRK